MSGPRGTRRVAVAVGVGAFLLRLPALGRPATLVFDELFYAPDAADLLRWGAEHGQPAHPALGKWLIGTGIAVSGFDPVGWRIASVVAGALLCAVVAATASHLSGRAAIGAAAGALVALDGLVHVTSRLALLDVFLALFTTASIAALVLAVLAQPDLRRAQRWWWAAVGALALGTAVKWSALTMAPLVAGVGWVLAGRLAAVTGGVRWRGRARALLAVAVLPPLALVAVALPRQLGPDRTTPAGYLTEQRAVARFHRELRPDNSNAASAWTWVAQTHPVHLYRSRCPLAPPAPGADPGADRRRTTDGSCRDGPRVARIVAGANPVVWLLGLLGLGWAAVAARRGDEVAVVLAGGVAATWLPWLLSPRVSYAFYAVTVVPALVLAAAGAVSALPTRARRVVPALAVGLAGAAFVALWPVWSAQPIPPTVDRWLTWWPGWS